MLYVSGLNTPIRRQRLTECTEKARPNYMLPIRNILERQKQKNGKNIYHTNTKRKKAGMAILTLDKIDFKTRSITKDERRRDIS